MTREDWERLKPLFEQAAELPVAARGDFIEKVRVEEPGLGGMLKDFLRTAEGIESFDKPFFDIHEALLEQTATMSGPGPGQIIAGRFRVLRHVGKGGMGEVYEAEDIQLKEHVALKTIRPEIAANPVATARFKREIQLGKKVTHPNVCRIHDLGMTQSDGGGAMFFLTMEFLQGETLSSRIRREPLSVAEALPLIENMADGLTAAHNAGVVHRDFKSGNVMLVNSGDRVRAIITDFGLARAFQSADDLSSISKSGAVPGTAAYMAPEQIKGEEVTPAADIYALGVVMYEMLTGYCPFTGGSDASIRMKHIQEQPRPPSELAPELDSNWDRVILRCLRKNPKHRFPSAAELKSALMSGSRSFALAKHRMRSAPYAASLALAVISALGWGAWNYRKATVSSTPHSQRVAVLEFENIGGDPVNQAFCDGLMESLSSKLTELEQFQGSLSVVPASDVRREKVTSVRDAEREFGANLAITGSVQRSPAGVRLTVNVVDARELKQLRSHGMFIPETDAVSMQQGVVTQVTDLLDIQLRPEAQRRLAAGNTPVPGAYDFYLQGSGYLLAGRAGLDQAIEEFQHALALDANYALAHAGLGEAYWNKYVETKDQAWIDRAWQECKRSIELAPQMSAGYVTLALLNSGTGHYDEAIRQAKKAIGIDPGNYLAYSELSRALDATHQADAAEATLKKAIELKPGYWGSYDRLGIFYLNHGNYPEALRSFTRVIELVPDNPAGYTNLGIIYQLLDREPEAEQMLKKSIQVRPTPMAYSELATVYFFLRRPADAVPIYEKLVAAGATNYVIWGNLGDAYRWTPGTAEKAPAAYRQAIDLAAQALNVNHRDAGALVSMALYLAKTGQKQQALRNMDKALLYAPDDRNVLFNTAIVCELTGNRNRALQTLEKALDSGYSLNEVTAEPELSKLRVDRRYVKFIASSNSNRR